MTTFDKTAPVYRYFTADLLTNSIIAEVPFKGVSYERSLKSAGSFSGSIAVLDATAAYNLYDSTLPGRTALYVVRNNVCVWGGIIWSRSYNAISKELSVSGSEFTSYLHHRNIWKTYSHDFSATAVSNSGLVTFTLDDNEYHFTAGSPVYIEFYETSEYQFNGYRTVLALNLTSQSFVAGVAGLPTGTYPKCTVRVRVDTYDYVRELLNEMQIDFSTSRFANSEIKPGVRTKYSISAKSLTDNVATVTTSSAHDVSVGQSVEIDNVGSEFDGMRTATAVTSTTVSFLSENTNVANTPITPLIASVVKKELDSTTSLVTLTTSTSHGFSTGQYVDITNVDDPAAVYEVYNGRHQIESVPNSTTFTYYVYMPGSEVYEATVTNISHPIITDAGYAYGAFFYFCDNAFVKGQIVTITGVTPAAYNLVDAEIYDATPTWFSVLNASSPDPYESGGEVVGYLTVTADNSLKEGDVVDITGVTPGDYNLSGATVVTVSPAYFTIESDLTVAYESGGSVNVVVPLSGTATVSRNLWSSTFGPYPGNADIGLAASTSEYSGVNALNKTYRGYELRSIGEELDQYSDIPDGFEYRVDCAYDGETNSFSRTFVLLPIQVPNPPAPGEVSPLSRFGADQIVFEYPGNVRNVTMDESAENAATRFFVVGNIDDLGGDASQPYAVATATDLLNQGWPLLDAETSVQNVDNPVYQDLFSSGMSYENKLYKFASRYLSEFRPPVSDFKISVNGSIDPVVGTYVPGDWCSVIIYDKFVEMRMRSNLEVRNDILVRKIENISVSVPDGVAYPEEVQITLIPEWEVDKIGQ